MPYAYIFQLQFGPSVPWAVTKRSRLNQSVCAVGTGLLSTRMVLGLITSHVSLLQSLPADSLGNIQSTLTFKKWQSHIKSNKFHPKPTKCSLLLSFMHVYCFWCLLMKSSHQTVQSSSSRVSPSMEVIRACSEFPATGTVDVCRCCIESSHLHVCKDAAKTQKASAS